MEQTVVVLFRNALAHYTVAVDDESGFEANLKKYGGEPHNQPPPQICFVKEGRHCSGNTEEADLMDDLYDAIKLNKEDQINGASSLLHEAHRGSE
ncbi:hypothetical protein [Pseudocnuella soli]|uniref:hypothetical protein n=1 Tax=Pseudocnuella soli TaxID=2502779 RepID=UPI00104A9C1F|nr:hypothetical protein [Pseudocnuella soli]